LWGRTARSGEGGVGGRGAWLTCFRYGELMRRCWSADVSERPSFDEIVRELDGRCDDEGGAADFENGTLLSERSVKTNG
jgi:hypothetical protein